MSATSVCEYLEWDSEFFGRRIARASGMCLTEELVTEIGAWCSLHRIECLYFLATARDQGTVRLAQRNGFRFVDIRLTLDFRVGTAGGGETDDSSFAVREAVEGDLPTLRELARAGHRDSRFYYDGNFSMRQCDALYETWIEKSCRGWAQKVLVADRGRGAEGYVTCHISDPANGQIGLVSVGEKARGLGMGRYLVCDAIQWFAQEGIGNITVATQGRNVSAQRLYQRCGFVTRSVELWFHKWFTESGRNE